MRTLRFAIFGCGFWARYQLAGWREAGGAELVGLYNRTLSKAHGLADEFGLPRSACFDDPEALLRTVRPDFVDIITSVETHAPLSALAARHGTAAICQKPMAPDAAAARRMHATAEAAGVPLLIHENWRWQTPIRAFRAALANPALGACFRARVTFSCSFPVFDNQPFLRDLPQFILTDIGSHVLDTARFLFGDAGPCSPAPGA